MEDDGVGDQGGDRGQEEHRPPAGPEAQPGESINEVHLAEELGVSRTPLREALISLEREGIITSERGKGFRFAPTGKREFLDLTAILIALESLALRTSDPAHLSAIAPRLPPRPPVKACLTIPAGRATGTARSRGWTCSRGSRTC
ncbi:GntR family transcriptional regulator [Kitasatospora xanthocidica]|uniref:GntR family transcriptional regulator n=1 Tax=Kitasatospora xanthocidica TaxID=83382 RepID=UPI0036E8CC13